MFDAKYTFLQKMEQTLANVVTVTEMSKILNVASDILQEFDMRSITKWTDERDDLLDCFISAMSVENRSKKTIERYTYVIKKVMQYVKVPTRQITVYHLRTFLQAEKQRGIKDSTLEGTRQVLSSYFNWLQRESLIDRNPMINLGAIKVAKKQKKIYTEIEMAKLYTSCKSARDRAIISFLASTGCRVSEMTELNRSAINLSQLECTVHGKGDKERTVYLSQVAGMYLKEYLKTRLDDNPALFIGIRHERLQPGGVRQMLKVLARTAGVKHVHPHKFRRTLATEMSRHGMAIQEVANILGHEKIDTTMRYVVLNKDDVKSSYRKYA